jgi:fluoride exporter
VRIDRRELIAIFCGGALGALLRAGAVELFATRAGSWPWPTFAINVTGSFVLGFVVTRLQERLPLSAYRRPFVGTGFCGALTTFSAFQLELVRMVDTDHARLAVGYGAASVATGFAALLIGTSVVRRARFAR